jgi:hypothetical protein
MRRRLGAVAQPDHADASTITTAVPGHRRPHCGSSVDNYAVNDDPAALDLYHAVHELFDEDDGALPEVQIDGVRPEEAQTIFDALVDLAVPLREDQTYSDQERDEGLPISSRADVARLAAEGQVTGLHVVLEGLNWAGGPVPDLGVSVWPGTVALDYRPGPEWSPTVVARFVSMLSMLAGRSSEGQLVAADEGSNTLPAHRQEQFNRAIARYRMHGD